MPVVGPQLIGRQHANVDLLLDAQVGHILHQIHEHLKHHGAEVLHCLTRISFNFCQSEDFS